MKVAMMASAVAPFAALAMNVDDLPDCVSIGQQQNCVCREAGACQKFGFTGVSVVCEPGTCEGAVWKDGGKATCMDSTACVGATFRKGTHVVCENDACGDQTFNGVFVECNGNSCQGAEMLVGELICKGTSCGKAQLLSMEKVVCEDASCAEAAFGMGEGNVFCKGAQACVNGECGFVSDVQVWCDAECSLNNDTSFSGGGCKDTNKRDGSPDWFPLVPPAEPSPPGPSPPGPGPTVTPDPVPTSNNPMPASSNVEPEPAPNDSGDAAAAIVTGFVPIIGLLLLSSVY